MTNYLSILAEELGISVALLLVMLAWIIIWKLIALWKAARREEPVWFIALAFINTVGILEILYVLIFSKFPKQTSKKLRKKQKIIRKSRKKNMPHFL